MNYNHKKIEAKWQKEWLRKKIYSPNLDKAKKPFYNLWMFPYPSAEGLHAGHSFASTGSDIYGRYMRMNGKDVFQPIGYDSFGIHSENFAIKINKTPQEMLSKTIKHYGEQLRSLGHGYDWNRTVTTSDIDYYRWTQWVFSQLFKAGLTYRRKAEVNWCPSCKTVLADEQVMTPKQAGKTPKLGDGTTIKDSEDLSVCERCGTVVEKRELEQWFFRITDYADRLLSNLTKINWPKKIKVAQHNWIGKSSGMLLKFKKESGGEIEVFTTRPDTLNGATFIVQADDELYNKHKDSNEKFGEDTGECAINPLNGKRLPIWKANYIRSGYGTGNVMGVPGHDERDMEFAKKYHLDIVDKEPEESLWKKIEEKGWGRRHTNYHLRDWLISRQRYWGPPIPMIFCNKCKKEGKGWINGNKAKLLHKNQTDWEHAGWYPEESLPVALPTISDYQPKGDGRGPLASHEEFYKVKCPGCGSEATRETDVSDTFLDSAWYFFRYISTDDKNCPWDPERAKKWLPVNLYFGGAEHAVLHLMYARFVTMVFKDLKLVSHFEEPFTHFYAHGLMIKDGAKMSKSRGNVVNPDLYINKFGADTLRLYLMFMGPMDGYPDFRDTGIEGMKRFVSRVWGLYANYKNTENNNDNHSSELFAKTHKTIKKVTEDIERFHYNTAISAIMEFVNFLNNYKAKFQVIVPLGVPASRDDQSLSCWNFALESLCKLLAPFAPHMAEEIWVNILKQPFSVHNSAWPEYDEKLIVSDEANIVIMINGKPRSVYNITHNLSGMNKEKIIEQAKEDPKIKKWIEGKKIKNTIYVEGKLLNFVI